MRVFWEFLVIVGCLLPVYGSGFELLWTPASGSVDGYRIEASGDNGVTWVVTQTLVAPVPNAEGLIEATEPVPSVLTVYRIKAYNVNGEALLPHGLVGHDPSVPGLPPGWPSTSRVGSR